jgi:hypothetical protein
MSNVNQTAEAGTAQKKPLRRAFDCRRRPGCYGIKFEFFGHAVYAWPLTAAEYKDLRNFQKDVSRRGKNTVREAEALQESFSHKLEDASPEDRLRVQDEIESRLEAIEDEQNELTDEVEIYEADLLQRCLVDWELPGEDGVLECDPELLSPGDRKQLVILLQGASKLGTSEATDFLARSRH